MMKNKGFTLIEVMVVVAILALLAAVGVPNMMNAHQNAQRKAREINVVNVNAAKDQWAVLNNKRPGDSVVWTNINSYLGSTSANADSLNVGTNEIEIGDIGQSASYPIDNP